MPEERLFSATQSTPSLLLTDYTMLFLQPKTFEHAQCHRSSYLRIRSTFTVVLREKKILLTPSYSVTTINYVSVAKLWNALSGKKNFLLAWSNRKPTKVQTLQLNDVSLRKSGIKTDHTCKFLYNSNPKGLVFNIVRGFFWYRYLLLCNFPLWLAYQNLPISKTEFSHIVFL